MPPKRKYTKDDIVNAGLTITKEQGFGNISARNVAKVLHTSSKVIFNTFENMQELNNCVLEKAKHEYENYIFSAMENSPLKYKASGLAYIQFAHDQPNLFKLLFMRDRQNSSSVEDDATIPSILALISKSKNISIDQARQFHFYMWIFVHGIASMVATNYLKFDEKTIDKALNDIYLGFQSNFTKDE